MLLDNRKRIQQAVYHHSRHATWSHQLPNSISRAIQLQGMLGAQESLLYYYLARDYYTGTGAIIDAGSFLGKSASCLAAGLLDNPWAAKPVIHCYDHFQAENNQIWFLQHKCQVTAQTGQDIRHLFDQQTSNIRHMLHVHQQDFRQVTWQYGPIEILLIDIAKSQQLWANVISQMFTKLIPGISLVIHQDYHHILLPPYIQVVMQSLKDYFTLVIPKINSTAVFMLQQTIPQTIIDTCINYQYTLQQQTKLLQDATDQLPQQHRFYLQCLQIMYTIQDTHQKRQAITQLHHQCQADGSIIQPDIQQCLGQLQQQLSVSS